MEVIATPPTLATRDALGATTGCTRCLCVMLTHTFPYQVRRLYSL